MMHSRTAPALRVAEGGHEVPAARPLSCVLRAQARYSAAALDLTSFLKPTSQWNLAQLQQFCALGFKSDLGFTKQQLEAVSLLPEAKAFAACPARKDDITAGRWCVDLTGVPERRKSLVKAYANAAFVLLRFAIEEAEESRTKKKMPLLALQLATLCGFNDGKMFHITGARIAFNFAGKRINDKADVYAAKRTGDSDQLLLFWEDTTTADEGLLRESAAQIIGEMISVHWENWSHGNKPCVVYAVRLIDDMAAFFRLEMTAEQIKAVCEDGVVPNPKLQVDYVPRKALEGGDEYGVSLLDPDNRLFFVQMMACIREEMLEREVPELQSFTSARAAKRIKREDL